MNTVPCPNTTTLALVKGLLRLFIYDLKSSSEFRNLFVLLCLSLSIILAYWLTRDHQEIFSGGELAFQILCNISYGFIASYIFYIINIHLPKKRAINNEYIAIAVALAEIDSNFEKINDLFEISKEISFPNLKQKLTKHSTEDITLYADSFTTLSGKLPDDPQEQHFPEATCTAKNAVITFIWGCNVSLTRALDQLQHLQWNEQEQLKQIVLTIPQELKNTPLSILLSNSQEISNEVIASIFIKISQYIRAAERYPTFPQKILCYKKRIYPIMKNSIDEFEKRQTELIKNELPHEKSPAT